MSKQIRIFLIVIAVVLVGSTALFLVVNNSLVSPYYIHQQRQALREVCEKLSTDLAPLQVNVEYAEDNNGVVVAVVPNTGDINGMNEQLRKMFLSKGLGISKYWLWQEDYNSTVKNGTQQRVYGQENLGYNLLVQYLIKEDQLIAVATVIPHLSRPLALANTFSAVIMGAASILLMTLVCWMSISLEKAQQKVALKNEQMQQLINHISHDLKTPIALIKAYTSGMKDGIDDGSFLDTIVQQNERMEQLTLRLLYISKYEKSTILLNEVNISELLSKQLKIQATLFAERKLSVVQNIQQGLLLQSSTDTLGTIFENLLSNAAKYAIASPVTVLLRNEGTQIILEVKNPTDLAVETEIARLWEPFCIAESSRNSELSGSGLGLSLVRAAANSIDASHLCQIVDGQFCVEIKIKRR